MGTVLVCKLFVKQKYSTQFTAQILACFHIVCFNLSLPNSSFTSNHENIRYTGVGFSNIVSFIPCSVILCFPYSYAKSVISFGLFTSKNLTEQLIALKLQEGRREAFCNFLTGIRRLLLLFQICWGCFLV